MAKGHRRYQHWSWILSASLGLETVHRDQHAITQPEVKGRLLGRFKARLFPASRRRLDPHARAADTCRDPYGVRKESAERTSEIHARADGVVEYQRRPAPQWLSIGIQLPKHRRR
jgi:hypothetical protein